MTGHYFVVSEWLPKKNHEEEAWGMFKELMALTRKEPGCIRAHATRQVTHPGSPGRSQFTIVLLQEYIDIQAFDAHCASPYVANCVKKYIENKETGIIAEWTCRLFSDKE